MRQKERCQRKPNKWWSHEKEKEIHYGALSWTVVQQPILGKKTNQNRWVNKFHHFIEQVTEPT